MKRFVRFIPNLLTLCNLLSGVLAIIAILHYRSYEVGALLIALGAIFDLFDGMVARLLKASSSIGADLDSLSDVVSFGVAPAILAASTIYGGLVFKGLDDRMSLFLSAPFLLLALFASYRLALFNNDEGTNNYFRGLPVPANALLWIGVSLSCTYCEAIWWQWILPYYLILVISGPLMVSRQPMLSLKHLPAQCKAKSGALIIVAWGIVIAGAILGMILRDYAEAFRWSMLLYVAMSFILEKVIVRISDEIDSSQGH